MQLIRISVFCRFLLMKTGQRRPRCKRGNLLQHFSTDDVFVLSLTEHQHSSQIDGKAQIK